MRFVALLALVALVPLAAAGGYALNPDPAAPTLLETLTGDMKEIPGTREDSWLYVVTKGPLKGQSTDAAWALVQPQDFLAGQGALAGRYVRRECAIYSETGKDDLLVDGRMVAYCTQKGVTRKQVERHLRDVNNGTQKD